MDMGDTNDVGRRVGMFMSILALGALAGPPISGAINTATGGFKAVGYFAGWLDGRLLYWIYIADVFIRNIRPRWCWIDVHC